MTKQKQVKTALPDANSVIAIEMGKIFPSLFESQARRRTRFKESETEVLSKSIEKQGLFSPILVRPDAKGTTFEIVFGERRYLAVRKLQQKKINCFVRELADAEVLELQYEENHRRQENHPLDDAYLFKYLHEKEHYSIEQLADRLNTSKRNVAEKLKLNDLIGEAKTELENGSLPLKHAICLAKFAPATQKIIVEEKYAYRYGDADDGACPFEEFQEEVEEHILRQLSNAPFDPADERLHIKKLQCFNCEERTGFAPLLFPDFVKGDSCLNKTCFEMKTNVHLKLKREEIAANLPNPEQKAISEIVKDVPLVTSRSWVEEKSPFKKEKVLKEQKFLPEPECEYSEISLIVEGSRKGEETYICREKSCKVHHPAPPVSDHTEREREFKENLIRLRAENDLRKEVLYKATAIFSDSVTFWQFDDLVKKLIVEFWQISAFSKKHFVCQYLGIGSLNAPASTESFTAYVATLDKQKQSAVLFLLMHGREFEGSIDNLGNIDGLRQIALEFTDLGEI